MEIGMYKIVLAVLTVGVILYIMLNDPAKKY